MSNMSYPTIRKDQWPPLGYDSLFRATMVLRSQYPYAITCYRFHMHPGKVFIGITVILHCYELPVKRIPLKIPLIKCSPLGDGLKPR